MGEEAPQPPGGSHEQEPAVIRDPNALSVCAEVGIPRAERRPNLSDATQVEGGRRPPATLAGRRGGELLVAAECTRRSQLQAAAGALGGAPQKFAERC